MKSLLQDYKCSCGKLLLKGLIVNGVLEVKCRFCKEINIMSGAKGSSLGKDCFIVFIDKDGLVKKGSANASILLGYSSEYVSSLKIQDVFEGITDELFKDMWKKFQGRKTAEARLMLHYKTKEGKLEPARIEVQLVELPTEEYLSFTVYKNMHIWLATVA